MRSAVERACLSEELGWSSLNQGGGFWSRIKESSRTERSNNTHIEIIIKRKQGERLASHLGVHSSHPFVDNLATASTVVTGGGRTRRLSSRDRLKTSGKQLQHFLVGRHRTLSPWVQYYIVKFGPLSRIGSHHLEEQVLELLTYRGALLKHIKVLLRLILVNQFVAWVSSLGQVEGLAFGDHHKEADAEGKQVDLSTLVAWLLVHLGGHVTWSSFEFFESGLSISISQQSAEAEIAELDVHVSIEENIF